MEKTKQKSYSISIPRELFEAIHELKIKTGITKKHLIADLLKMGLNKYMDS